jgi:hypothetical protein
VSGDKQPDLPFEDFEAEGYRRWQKREEGKDNQAQSAHNKLIIENGDPEMEQAVAALEQGWLEGR